MAVVAPIPSMSVAITAAVSPGFFRNARNPWRRFLIRFRTRHLNVQDEALKGRGFSRAVSRQQMNSASADALLAPKMKRPRACPLVHVMSTLCVPIETVERSLKRGGLGRGVRCETGHGCPKANSPVRSRTLRFCHAERGLNFAQRIPTAVEASLQNLKCKSLAPRLHLTHACGHTRAHSP